MARPLVLIVDSHQDTLALYAIALSATGFDVMAATNCDQASARVRQVQPDVIVAALPMPDCDASVLFDRLEENPRMRDVPVLIMGGPGQPSSDERQDRGRVAARLATRCPPNELAIGLRRLLDATR